MTRDRPSVLPEVKAFLTTLEFASITSDRQAVLQSMTYCVRQKTEEQKIPQLHFICTHNSRRSQFGQVWCRVVSAYFGVDVATFSGGTEVTAVHPQVISSLKRSGLKIQSSGEKNAVHRVSFSSQAEPIVLFSKLYDHPDNPVKDFAAVMTCSHADTNCPFIPGAEKRFALHYPDPKSADGTADEAKAYDRCCRQIASEMVFLFQAL